MLENTEPVLLLPLETQVMRFFSKGLNPIETGKMLDINIKEVSRNKRNVMRKLDIKRSNELYIWLINGGLNDF